MRNIATIPARDREALFRNTAAKMGMSEATTVPLQTTTYSHELWISRTSSTVVRGRDTTLPSTAQFA